MPHSPDRKRRSRERILAAAHRLFAARGYEAVSIDEVMAEAGLTRGAFYAHFESKAALYAEALLSGPRRLHQAWRKKTGRREVASLEELVALYLSEAHLERRLGACPLAFFATDVANRDPRVRRVYTRVYGLFNEFVSQQLPKAVDDDRVLAATALMIGGVAVGRALDDPALRRRLLAACRREVQRMLEGQGVAG